ncbi:MAG TPA: hypothetical protein VLK65_11280 [Vicinamibacteria bacterium]|nr:hypothetical protein [Vicinamibacteria bacterium]
MLSLLAAMTAIAVTVPVRVAAPLPADVLQSALEEADSIFRPGGVVWEWSLDSGNDRSPAVMVHVEQRPSDFVVFGCSRDRHDHRLGNTHLGSRRITLWADQVARAVDGNWDRAELPDVDDGVLARALGRVLAHELGHLFLRLNGHRDDGLMRRAFPHRSLTSRSRRGFLLSKSDMEKLRASLVRYSSVARSERK